MIEGIEYLAGNQKMMDAFNIMVLLLNSSKIAWASEGEDAIILCGSRKTDRHHRRGRRSKTDKSSSR